VTGSGRNTRRQRSWFRLCCGDTAKRHDYAEATTIDLLNEISVFFKNGVFDVIKL
jgi:hypothetical protein